MALAGPSRQKDWNEWWNQLGGPRRIPWRERMMRWIKVEVREGEEAIVEEDADGEEEEEEEEEGRSEEKVEGEGKEPEKFESEEEDVDEDEETNVQKVEGERAEGKEDDEAQTFEVLPREEKEDEDGIEGPEVEDLDEERTREETIEEVEEGGESVQEKFEEEVEEEYEGLQREEKMDEGDGAKDEEEEESSGEERDEDDVTKTEDGDEEEMDESEEEEERDLKVPSREEEEQDEDLRLEDHVSELNEEDSDVAPSDIEFPNLERHNDNKVNNPEDSDGKSSRCGHVSIFGDSSTSDKDSSDKSRTVSESWTSEDDVDDVDFEDEESSDEDEAETSMDEDGEEAEVKTYSKNDHTSEVFRSLKEFREASLFTDLTLTTADGKTLEVHSLVLAAVSSFVWKKNLLRNKTQRKDRARTLAWSLPLGEEVERAGLEAIVEFAYTGRISTLNRGNAEEIEAAARSMGAPRVLELCAKVKKRSAESEKKQTTCGAQQLAVSLQFIRQLWMDGAGCDVTLEALGESLNAHRVILAVSSDYFRSMFTLGMKESRQHSVTLPFLLASELEVLIGSSYSGTLSLSWSCVFEITSVALQLQYQPALCLCFNFLHQEINPDSCLDVVSFAEAYELPQVLDAANDFILRQFQKVVPTSKFKDLPARQLLKYLKSRSLCVSSELVVFKAVVSWIQAKPRTRLRLTKTLMKTIHFPLMTFKEFKEVRSENMWSDHQLEALYQAIFQDFCTDETTFHNRCRVYLPKESLVLIGGEQTSDDLGRRNISKELWFGNSLRNLTGIRKAMEWRRLGEMPEPARFCHEVAVLKGQLYVFGGKKYYGNGDVLNSVHRFEPRKNSWEPLAEMLERRSSFSVVVLEGKMLALGGHSNSDFRDSVERYCPSANSWSYTWPLDLPLSGHAAKVYQGRIFVCGGRNDDYPCVASMFQYHPETGSTYLAEMAKPRAQHCMELLGDYLYVAGGISTDDQWNAVDQLSCEVYSPAANAWTTFAPFPVPHVGAGSAVLEGKFYVLGGYSQEDYSDTNMVHRYDPATQRWENMGMMPGPNNDIRACVLGLPEHFRS